MSMTEQDMLQLRDLAEARQVQLKERIADKNDKYEIGCEMVAFCNFRGVRRALEYDPNVIFSNEVDQREITHSANEFVITIPRKSEQVTNQGNLVPDTSTSELYNNQAQPEISIIANQAGENSNQPQSKSNQAHNKSNQAADILVTRPLTKKEQDIRNFCSVPRTAQEIMDRLEITNQSKNRQKYITSLIEIAVLERTIPDKPNDPNQKYRSKQ